MDVDTVIGKVLQPTIFLKIVASVLLLLYILFTIVTFTQIRVMNRIIHQSAGSQIVYTLGLLHIVFAISVLIAALVIV